MGRGKKPAKRPPPPSPRIMLHNVTEQVLVPRFDGLSVTDDCGIIPLDKTRRRSIAEDVHARELTAELRVARAAEVTKSKLENDFVEVTSTPDRGLAVFSTRKIKAGTLLLAEHPLISLDKHEENDYSAIEREFSRLSHADQKIYLRLFDAQKSRMSRVVSIYYSNCYNCEGFRPSGLGGSAIGALSSRLNHSCVPNVQFSYDEASNEMRFYAIRDISRGKEICSNYDKSVFEPAAKRRRKQQMYYGFVCRCEACEPKTEFWAKSDERRLGMYDAIRAVQWCDKKLAAGNEEVVVEKAQAGEAEFVQEAWDSLTRLEGLLLKESLVGAPLANTYRSMAKWAERKGHEGVDEAVRWKVKELETCIIAFGRDCQRTKDIEAKLEAHQAGRSI
ncbi:uncharacterized protein Z520_01350 [Fonsecaea multimorphosa CBS 102226]|uniref:SET domain-containing protein n=1 Tax=Fonsecaea multimorphosa CBS 102226 TaxID=1442371 RepID=A0A0D2KHG1_9EURO|nr:uncharacterized protein Z520_01350 [Fonsecaea multimorphosa CBS 102226]KIY02885.1 hypothetical protein Z520_01350 [Fonsecaea multimorphosa CBS 102226]OAL30721.1 hypothetical protein AYO22_01341 [Fonsecaea multimorphosa]